MHNQTKTNDEFRIIIIDDNPEIHHDFIKILTNSPSSSLNSLKQQIFSQNKDQITLPQFQIDTASQGKEGYERIAEAIKQGKPYALAFVDIRMPPGWDGIETIKHIWELDKTIQIVICTAYSDYSWEETIAQLGKSDNLLILKKPFDFIAVRQLASALTKKWQLFQESKQYTASLEQRIQERTETIQQSLSRLRATLESSTDGILVIDNNNNVVDFNKKFFSMWGIPERLEKEKSFDLFINYFKNELLSPNDFLADILDLKMDPEKIIINTIKFKNERIFEYYSQPQKLDDKTIGRVYSFRDITERAELENKLKYQANHDSLTKLPNRVLLQEVINRSISECFQTNEMFAILFFDLDRFKLINDSLSHAAGDDLLTTLAKRLESAIRSCDMVARLGGDEFVIVVKNITNEKNVRDIAENLLEVISSPFILDNREITITTSIGVSIFPKDGKTTDILLRNADAAMYLAKKNGANHYQFYSEDLNRESLEFLEKEMQLRQAIARNEFFLLYQPQMDIKQDKLVAVEALVRWQHPEKGLILPIDFIPLAEETGLIIPIGEWVLKTACKQNKDWQDAGLPPIRVAVNITTQQLNQYNLVDFVKKVLNETELEPKYLELELTENSIVSNTSAINTINTLKELGIHIALDDFGTGYSGLSYLKNLQLDRLKIDRSFVKNIQINRGDEVIIQAIITMAHSLNLEVLAEGVETEAQMDFLKNLKCGEIQGYYFNKPLSSSDLEKVLKDPQNNNAKKILKKEEA